jgi:dTDP-4-dehydrorhamnose reductase
MSAKPGALLFGATGQVGSAILPSLRERFDVTAVSRADVDLRDAAAIDEAIRRSSPTLIVNAAAYTGVDAAESDAEVTELVNAAAPRAMAAAARGVGASLIHFSTDYVFDGEKRSPYTETDAPRPLNVYGETKLRGDEAIAESGTPFLILRTSWIYAARGRNFLNAILNRARTAGEVRVVDDQTGAPTSAAQIAQGCIEIIDRLTISDDISRAMGAVSGVYNLTAAGETTWFGFAQEILSRAGVQARVEPISTEQFGAAARRPRYSLLDNTKVAETFGVRLADWRAGLAEVL